MFDALLAGGQRVQAELLHELHQDVLESRAEEGESAEEGRRHQDSCVEGAVQGGAGRNSGRNMTSANGFQSSIKYNLSWFLSAMFITHKSFCLRNNHPIFCHKQHFFLTNQHVPKWWFHLKENCLIL